MKKLSLILCSRNDNYCGNPVDRLQRVLNHTGDMLYGKRAEVIVSDWGSRLPLAEVLELNQKARAITRFNYIPEERTSRIPTKFSEVHAHNSAARIASGEFIGRIDQDILVGERFVDWFFDTGPSEGCFYWSGRKELPPGTYYEHRESARREDQPWNIDPENFWRSYTGILLVPIRHYYALGGYDETNIFTNHMEHEFIFRLKKVVELVDLGRLLDYDFYHIFHDRRDNRISSMNRQLKPRELEALPLKPNGEDWGYVNYSRRVGSLRRIMAAARGYRTMIGDMLRKRRLIGT
jgi:hypothetical protein